MRNIKIKTWTTVFIFLTLFIIGTSQAKAACSWVAEKTYYKASEKKTVTEEGCSAVQIKNIDSKCSGTKPTYPVENGSATLAVCCCDKDEKAVVASEQTCSWQKATSYFDNTTKKTVETTCTPGTSVYEDSNCSGTKPTYNSTNGVTEKAICCCKSGVANKNELTNNAPKFVIPDFQVEIPGLKKLSEVKCENGECKIYWIAEYTAGVYKYGLTIVGIIAVLFLMAAGLLWIVSGGDSNKISQAKKMILGSITGLFLMVGLNMILAFINPDLTKPKAITLSYIEKIDLFALAPEDQALAPTSAGSSHGVPWYFQCSALGKKTSYDLNGKCGDKSTICSSGCGVVSTLMVLGKYGENPSLSEFANKVMSSGGRVCGNGSTGVGLIKAANAYGLKGAFLGGLPDVEKKLDAGYPVIISVRETSGNCIFTNGGHFIVLTGWREKENKIADVNDPGNSRKKPERTWISLRNLGGCSLGQAFYLYK